jgi:hypothetical protein
MLVDIMCIIGGVLMSVRWRRADADLLGSVVVVAGAAADPRGLRPLSSL